MNSATRFTIGRLVSTVTALNTVSLEDMTRALDRHRLGDWGDVCPEDREANNHANIEGGRLLSSYRNSEGIPFWIITEADRSSTTILLPDDY